jgi:hypothetical protein
MFIGDTSVNILVDIPGGLSPSTDYVVWFL